MKMIEQYELFCQQLEAKHLLRKLCPQQNYQYDFSHNDYLNLRQHPALQEAAIAAARQYGLGSGASQLIYQQSLLQELEQQVAKDKKSEAALIFATGYQANVGVLAALLDTSVLKTSPLVFSDKLNHASMHAGCQLAGIKQIRFRHADYDHLESLLKKHTKDTHPCFILSESVFGMDGDIANLAKLTQLANEFNALLYLDEAHATGLFGCEGFGLSSDFSKDTHLSLGTFSKALGTSGGYVACSQTVKNYLVQRCASFIYSTAPSPVQIAAMLAAWQLIPSLHPHVEPLFNLADCLRSELQQFGLNTGVSSQSHIVPIVVGCPAKTLRLQSALAKHGIGVSAIRPPSVMPNQSRLRIALNLSHNQKSIDYLVSTLKQVY